MIDVCLLGTGGMMPLPGRALTSLYVRNEGHAVLIDCGEGTQTAIRTAGLRLKPIDAILFTHFHADHISGLPGLLLSMGNEGRTDEVALYGPAGLERIVNALCLIAPELPFELEFHEFAQRETQQFICAGLDVQAFPADHGVACYGYCLEKKRIGKFDSNRAKALGIPVECWSRLQHGEHVDGFAPEEVLGPPRKGLKLLYATDSRPVPAMEELGSGADLMVLEGMYGDPEKQLRAEESHHMMMQEAAQIAADANPAQLWLTHFSPATPEPEEYAQQIAAIFANTKIGTDGMRTTLRFHE